MRNFRRILLAASGAALAGLAPAAAAAQNDVTPRLPNVLLLLDTSGSMEYLLQPDPSDPTGATPMTPESPNAPAGAACSLNGTTTVLNKWASLVSVLTGTFAPGSFGCQTVQRNSASFVSEYTLPGTTVPYDYGYFLPWHRIYSNGCTLGANPIVSPQAWSNWGNNPYNLHTSAGTCTAGVNCCPSWSGQYDDGVLDLFSGLVRFGLMTFDSFPDPSTGATVGSPSDVNGPSAVAGMWSYFHGWQSYTTPTPAVPPAGHVGPGNPPEAGSPNACATSRFMEVGARNPAAPPWEGPLAPFGNPLTDSNVAQSNAAIQQEVLAMRPYGATPIAGMLDDASEFLFSDNTLVPNASPQQNFGPYQDPYWMGGCRKTYVILLTDGQPNLDLRGPTGQCDATPPDGTHPGSCPYLLPEQIITNMRVAPATGNANQSVTTYVVGFAVSNPAQLPPGMTSCSQLTAANCAPPVAAGLAACCELQKLALAGANTNDPVFMGQQPHAFFADNPGVLKQILSAILSATIGSTTARTAPVYAAAGPVLPQGFPSNTAALSYNFAASFNVTSSPTTSTSGTVSNGAGGVWTGNLVRERFTCPSGATAPVPLAVDPTSGDNFASNVNYNDLAHPRQYFTVIAKPTSTGQINSDWTIRPNVLVDDGFGVNVPLPATTPVLSAAPAFLTLASTYPAAFAITSSTTNCNNAFGVANQPSQCASDLMNWEIGGTNVLGTAFTPAISRDPTSAYCTNNSKFQMCSKLGAIYHSTPLVAGPPREFLRDDTYTAYASTRAADPIMLYTASIDGQLHGFKVSATSSTDTFTTNTLANNELWSFLPPAVLQHILPNFNAGGANLLDGAPVVADVPGSTALGVSPPLFERTPGSVANWHRVLVASGGQAGGFYYALDITNPTAPTFLWQIATDGSGNRMFGATTPTPAIASVALLEQNVRTQVAVAILPGGSGTQLPNCTTPPAHPAHTNITPNDPLNPSNPGGSIYTLAGFNPPPLRCWAGYSVTNPSGYVSGSSATGNSVTIVRLDTGAVLAHFTGTGYYGAVGGGVLGDPGTHLTGGNTGNIFTTLPMTAPMTGIPVVFPADTGQIADRAYLADADGQLWRIDLSSTSPSGWSMTLAWDAYVDSSTAAREVVSLAPVLSRDPVGNMTIMYATGDQNLLTSLSNDNRVWSLTETPLNLTTSQNWVIKFPAGLTSTAWPAGNRVTGPMALFNNVLYFSTYQPVSNTSAVCANGEPTLWGVDYRRPDTTASTPGTPLPGLSTSAATPTLFQSGAAGSVIFGVSAAVTPACTSPSVTTQDPYFGAHTQVSGLQPSSYRIMWQTGAGTGLTTGAKVSNESGISAMQNMAVTAPGQSTKIDSWAALIE